jgi:phenylacetate-coenzyme A ligase PaaK-like adenylate-forming protein
LDEIRIRVEARPELLVASHPMQATTLGAKLKDVIGISAEIKVVSSGSLPRSTGKGMHVKDLR